MPRSHRNYPEEIPALMNRTKIFVDPISYIITSAGSPDHCNDITQVRRKMVL